MIADRLAQLAATAEPPALDDHVASRMIERAVAGASRPVAPRRSYAWPLAAAALAIALAVALWPRAQVVPPAELLHVNLPTGDRLVGTAGARFDIEALAPAARRLRLREGTMLFDVAHVVPGQRFEVATDQVTVVARGTVFSVTTDAARTSVHVYEGAVDVIEAGRAHAVVAGASWTTGGAAVETAAIAVEANEAIVARATEPRITAKAPRRQDLPNEISAEPQLRTESPRTRPEPSPPLAPRRLGGNSSPPPPDDGASLRARADDLRAQGRIAEAADALDEAAKKLAGAARAEAAYTAAYMRFRELHDGDGALASLTAGDVDDIGSPFAERGLALRAQIDKSLHRDADAAEAATHYLERYPHGDLARYMQSLLKRE